MHDDRSAAAAANGGYVVVEASELWFQRIYELIQWQHPRLPVRERYVAHQTLKNLGNHLQA